MGVTNLGIGTDRPVNYSTERTGPNSIWIWTRNKGEDKNHNPNKNPSPTISLVPIITQNIQ